MREVIMGLLFMVLLSGSAYLVNRDVKNAEKEHEKIKETYIHLAPKVKALSILSGDKHQGFYQYVQDQTTGLGSYANQWGSPRLRTEKALRCW